MWAVFHQGTEAGQHWGSGTEVSNGEMKGWEGW